jgi:uncharacterized membrane protein YjjP (DUF1212 family)
MLYRLSYSGTATRWPVHIVGHLRHTAACRLNTRRRRFDGSLGYLREKAIIMEVTAVWFAQRNRSARAHNPPGFLGTRRVDGGGKPSASTGNGQGVQGPSVPDDSMVHFVLDLAVRIGEVQMSVGAGAADATATIIAVANAYGLPHCEVDVIFTSITVTCQRGVDQPPVTSLRVVRSRSLDYTRLALVERLVRDITHGRVAVRDARAELNRITTASHPYPRWVATLAYAGMAAAIALLIGGDATVAACAALTTALVDRVGRLLNRRALPFFFQQVVGGVLATGAALALLATGVLGESRPTVVVAAAITVLLSGLSVVSVVQDAITGYNVTAAGRTMEVSLMTAGLIAGVVLALNAAVELGMPAQGLGDPLAPSVLRLPLQTVAGGAAAGLFARCWSRRWPAPRGRAATARWCWPASGRSPRPGSPPP